MLRNVPIGKHHQRWWIKVGCCRWIGNQNRNAFNASRSNEGGAIGYQRSSLLPSGSFRPSSAHASTWRDVLDYVGDDAGDSYRAVPLYQPEDYNILNEVPACIAQLLRCQLKSLAADHGMEDEMHFPQSLSGSNQPAPYVVQ